MIKIMNTAKDLKDLPLTLTVNQVAKLLGVSRRVAYNLMRQRGFPSVRVGEKRIIIPRDHFLRWLDENAKKPIN